MQTSKCANGQASSPAFQSGFLVILDRSEPISTPASFYSRVCPSILEITNKHHLDQAHCGSDQPRIGRQVLSHSLVCSLFQLLALHCPQRSFICLLTPKLVTKWMIGCLKSTGFCPIVRRGLEDATTSLVFIKASFIILNIYHRFDVISELS